MRRSWRPRWSTTSAASTSEPRKASRRSRFSIRSTSCRPPEAAQNRAAARVEPSNDGGGANPIIRLTIEPRARSDSDKGKPTERWRRKVTGLQGSEPQDSGTAGIESDLRTSAARTDEAIAPAVERGREVGPRRTSRFEGAPQRDPAAAHPRALPGRRLLGAGGQLLRLPERRARRLRRHAGPVPAQHRPE